MGEDGNYPTDGADGPDWDSGLEDDSSGVMKAVGRQIKAWREAAGLTQTEFGDLGKLRHVEIQVMPTDTEEHAGLGGSLQVRKLSDGPTVGHNEVQLTSRLISAPKEVQVLEMRYGMIRAQALTPRQSLAFIEKLRGET